MFGIPGVHTLELYRGLPGSGIRHVLTRHEQGAGFMADGYARVSGKPGVCFVITGPGVTNAATAIGQAYADSIPMLVISSVNSIASLGKGWGILHETHDQRAITAPITAFSAVALSAEDLPELVARAYAVFDSERPRPVHIRCRWMCWRRRSSGIGAMKSCGVLGVVCPRPTCWTRPRPNSQRPSVR